MDERRMHASSSSDCTLHSTSNSALVALYSPNVGEVWNSRKSISRILNRKLPQSRNGLAPRRIPTPGEGSYILWCWIDMRDRECSTATVACERSTHASCVALRLPVDIDLAQCLISMPSAAWRPMLAIQC